MIIKNLSIAAGGGVIVTNDQAEQETGAHIFIGLGGTGIDCLRNVKRQVFNRLKPDDEESVVKQYSHIRFLALDTDRTSLGGDESISAIDSVTEFIDISCSDIHALIENPDLLYQYPSKRWLSSRITIQNAYAGAGGVRQIGRLLVMQNVTSITEKIGNTITQALTGLDAQDPVNIHIFTGLGGGTGSGTFLDICYLLQYVLDRQALKGRAQTCGYFFLPDVNMAKISVAAVNDYIQINGFAAMKELDYCMNFCNNGGEWNQSYDSFSIKTTAQPVKLAHLITAKDEGGAIKANGYDYAMNVVTDYVLEFMTRQEVSDQDRKSGEFGLASHIGNFEKIVEMLKKRRGARYYYCVLGASNAYIPYKDINTYLAAKIFKAYDLLPDYNHDIQNFVTTQGISYEDILRRLEDNVPIIPTYEVDKTVMHEQVQGLSSDNIPRVLSRMRDTHAQINGMLATNRESLCDSLIDSIKNALYTLSTTPGRGPVYASLILKNTGKEDKDLINIVQGYIEQNETNLGLARADLKLNIDTMGQALTRIQNRKKKSYSDNYRDAVWSYYTQYAKISLYIEMSEVLRVFKEKLVRLYESGYAHLVRRLKDISETMDANFRDLNSNVETANEYAVKIVDLSEKGFKKSLDEDVDHMDCPSIVLRLIAELIGKQDDWIENDDGVRIANIVSEFFAKELAVSNAGIDSYIRKKYNIEAQDALATKIYNALMTPLMNKANPLFWVHDIDGKLDPRSKTGYCSVPSVSKVIQLAGVQLNSAHNEIKMRISEMRDRISLLVFYCGVPMFQFKGSFDYKPAYQDVYVVGAHLYEGARENDNPLKDRRDFRNLHDIIPFSLINRRENKELKKFHDDFKMAVDYGIVFPKKIGTSGDAVEYIMQIVNPDDVAKRLDKIKRLRRDNNQIHIRSFLDNPENKKVGFRDEYILPNTGYGEFKESAVEDHIFASQKLRDIMYEQLARINDYVQEYKNLEKDGSEWIWLQKTTKAFAEALCTDVIHKGKNRYEFMYRKDNGFSTDDITLTDIDFEPYGMSMPIYSAFVEFNKLPDDEKEEIGKMVKDRLINDENLCIDASKKAREYLLDKIESIIENAQSHFASEAVRIKQIMLMINRAIESLIRSLS